MAALRLIRLPQWSKGVFVLVGPLYSVQDRPPEDPLGMALSVGATFILFGLVSSACYVFNDLQDVQADRAHPRKRNRPIASGAIAPAAAVRIAAGLLIAAAATLVVLPGPARWMVGGLAGLHLANVLTYSVFTKHRVILDVLSLSMGFVFRVLAGCAAALVEPSTWLLNVTLFLAMLLAFGKRLGERRTAERADDPETTAAPSPPESGASAAASRGAAAYRRVQAGYSDELLRMLVVVSGVATLLTYAGYIQTRDDDYTYGFNLLWLTILPATFGLLRAIALLERGTYDDPTELATKDPPFQASALAFALLTAGVVALGG